MAVMFTFNTLAGQTNCCASSSIIEIASLTGLNDIGYDLTVLVDA